MNNIEDINKDTVYEYCVAIYNTNNGLAARCLSHNRKLYGLLYVYYTGATDVHVRHVTATDMETLYASASANWQTGYHVAKRIYDKVQGQIRRTPHVPPPTMKIDPDVFQGLPPDPYVLESKFNTFRDNVLNRLLKVENKSYASGGAASSAKLEELRRDFTDAMLKITEVLPDVIKKEVQDAYRVQTPTTLTIIPQMAPTVPLGLVHYKTETLIKMLAADVNVYLYGPAGSGKTTAAQKAAEAFGLKFYFAAKVESEYMLLGFKDARGETVRTQFREAYEHGGVFLFDELDGSSPSAVVALNAALANGVCPFPDAIITRHKDFKCIAAGNTGLTGASRQYTGRVQLDAASIDRFAFLDWGYDHALEMELASDKQWCAYVQAIRKAVADRGLQHLVTPRATYDGCKLLAAGLLPDDVEEMVIFKALDDDTVMSLLRTVGDYSDYAPKQVEPEEPDANAGTELDTDKEIDVLNIHKSPIDISPMFKNVI